MDFMLFDIARFKNNGTSSLGTKTVFRPASPVLVKWSMNGLHVRSTSGCLFTHNMQQVNALTGTSLEILSVNVLKKTASICAQNY